MDQPFPAFLEEPGLPSAAMAPGHAATTALELVLAPAAVDRLLRRRGLGGGRWRAAAMETIWHDTPDGTLAARDLAVSHSDGRWILARATPGAGAGAGPWPPGAPAPVLAVEADPQALGFGLLDLPPPIAALRGRLLSRTLADAGPESGTQLTLIDGALQAPSGERRCCRLTIAGRPDRVARLALLLARALPLAVPTATLAAEAAALAQGTRAPPRRLGAPALGTDLSVGEAFAAILGHLTDVVLHWAPLATRDDGEAVHQMRVAVRRLRSALSVFSDAIAGPATADVKLALKALGTALGPARDWDVFVSETGAQVAAALPEDASITALLLAAGRRRAAHHATLRAYLDGDAFRLLGVSIACLLLTAPWQESGDMALIAGPLGALAAPILRRRSKQLLAPGGTVTGLAVPALHDLRLRAKRLRYATEFFAPLYPAARSERFLRRLSKLQAALGLLNDGAVAAGLLAELAPEAPAFACGLVRGFVAAEAHGARRQIGGAWRKFRRHQPFLKAVVK